MMHSRLLAPVVTGVLLTSIACSQNGNWPEYRGPTQHGRAPNAKVPLEWSETKNVTWKTAIPGMGWSSPVVFGDRIWMTTAPRDGHTMSVIAIDAKSGKKVVDRVLFENDNPEPRSPLNSYASPSPTIERGRVYVHFGTYGTACLDTATGKTIWQRRDLNCDHMKQGPGSSPILWRDLLIFNVDGGDVQYVIALDKKTGKTRWTQKRSVDLLRLRGDLRKAYGTPIVVEVDGKDRLISTGSRATNAYDPETGKELWMVRHTGFSMSSRPMADAGLVFINTGFMSARLLGVRLEGEGDVTDSNIVWSYRRSVPKMASALLVDGLIYMVSDEGMVTCLEAATGERVWRERLDASHCASPVYAGGRIYFFDREGASVVIAPGREFKKLAENTLDAGFMASTAVTGDAFILRTKTHLYRIEEAAAAQQESAVSGWSRFRGPNGTGIVESENLPVEFGPKRNVVWKTTLPPGHSSPVLSAAHVFLTAFEGEKLFTYCLDRATGKITWRREAKRPRTAKYDRRNNAASPTPAVDDDTVVVFFEDFGMIAYDHAGKKLWEFPLGPFNNEYGMGASPVLLEDRVFLACDQTRGSFLLAVRKVDGKQVFKVDRPEAKSGHCTPIIYRPEKGNPQLILPGSFLLDAYDTRTGEKVWWVHGLSFEMKSTPVLHEGTIYINGYGSPMNQPGSLIKLPEFKPTLAEHDADNDGLISKNEIPRFRGSRMLFGFVDLSDDGKLDAKDWAFLRAALASKNGMLAIRAGGRGDMTEKSVRWTYHRSVPQLPSPLVYRGVVYLLNDQGGILVRLRPGTGEVIERGRVKGAIDNYYASPVAGDGKVYLVSEGGMVSVLKAGGDLTPLAINDLSEECHATPALGKGRIFIRTRTALYCFGYDEKRR